MQKLRKKRRHHAQGLCTYCSRPQQPGFLCCEKHVRLNREYMASWRKRQTQKGLCSICVEPRWGGTKFCLKHREFNRLRMQRRSWRRKAERLRIAREVTHEPR